MDTRRTDNNGSLPYSEDAEKGVLCSLILSPREVAKFCAELLHPDAFYVPAHRIIYEALFAWPKDGLIDFVWLKSQLKRSRQLDEVGGPEFLNQLYTFVPSQRRAPVFRHCPSM
jgi:replicative DNA helicase